MKQVKEATRIERIEEFLKSLDTEIDILDYVDDVESIKSYDDLYEQIDEEGGFNAEIIYYGNAMEYLTENDTSLAESMGIASELGFDVANINSELLASLLRSRELREEFSELEGEINNFFNELDDEND